MLEDKAVDVHAIAIFTVLAHDLLHCLQVYRLFLDIRQQRILSCPWISYDLSIRICLVTDVMALIIYKGVLRCQRPGLSHILGPHEGHEHIIDEEVTTRSSTSRIYCFRFRFFCKDP